VERLNTITLSRYAIEGETPIHERITWQFIPDTPRSVEIPTYGPGWHRTAGWTSGGSSITEYHTPDEDGEGGLVYPADSPFWNPYAHPNRVGVVSCTREEYDALVTKIHADFEEQVTRAAASEPVVD